MVLASFAWSGAMTTDVLGLLAGALS
ncbi:MAG: hypothetical protein JWQ46_2061, partial [Phenylobacterium sp.]|nr:hypothetical protein [Phenylobacterium sp.]